jgi:arylsulfatase A-like enzyme
VSNWLRTVGSEPFFLWVHYQDPHGPYTPPESWRERFSPLEAPEDPDVLTVTDNYGHGGIPEYQCIDDARSPGEYRARYRAEIAFTDQMIGKLIADLKARGLWENSIVVFTADHGEALGEHDFWFCHGHNVTEDLIHVPLIVRIPAGAGGRGRVVDELVSGVDVAPTILDAAGLRGGLEGSGLSLVPLIEGATARLERNYVVAEDEFGRLCVRGRKTKYVVGPSEERLYDLGVDPREEIDILARMPDLVTEMRVLSDTYKEQAVAASGEDMKQSREEIRKLKSLGYVN